MTKRKKQALVGSISMINRIIKIIVGLLLSVLLTACSFFELSLNGSVYKEQNETKVIKGDYIHKTGKEIIRCIKEDDRESINALFCEKVRDSDYLNRKIDIVFDYIKENGITFESEKWSVPYSHGSFGNGHRTVQWVSGECKNIYINNKKYTLNIIAYEIIKGHPEYEGVLHIYFSELVDSDKLKGRVIKRNNTGGYLGIDLVNINYVDCIWENIVQNKYAENELYIIPDPDDLEKGRSNW